jgi:aspartyl-tRNA(Asn)/glutamyl-tRNA(Gln) amidotransferase subunit C
MTDPINLETFNHLVALAALELDEKEGEYLRQQLNNQLKAIRELEAIPLDDEIAVTSHGVPYTAQTSPALREDRWEPYPTPEVILGQVPESEDGYVVVPDIPHTTLD